MSALAVIWNKDDTPVNPEVLEAMVAQVSSLGPDGISYLYRGNIGLAYLALNSTHESLHEIQPLESEEKRYLLVADARIDNRTEMLSILHSYLPNKGIITDPDIILAAYRKWETDSPTHLIGNFAFVIWDTLNKTLFAASDALGLRGLYYAKCGNSLCLASEAVQIIEHPNANSNLSKIALSGWLISRPDPDRSPFAEIHLLPGGNQLQSTSITTCVKRYWPSPTTFNSIRYKHIEEYEQHLLNILTRVVSDSMRSQHQTIASELSGGLDSSTISALANQQVSKNKKKLLTISQVFGSIKSCDESDFIQEIIKYQRLTNKTFDAEKHGIMNFPKAYATMKFGPWVKHNPILHHTLELAATDGAGILLTGHGGDQLTAGHTLSYLYRILKGDLQTPTEVIQWAREVKSSNAKFLYHIFISPLVPQWLKQAIREIHGLPSKQQWPNWMSNEIPNKLDLSHHYFADTIHFENTIDQMRWNYLQFSPTRALARSNVHIAAPFKIEIRYPFLDQRLVDFCFSIPHDLWHRHGYSKWLLRSTVKNILPSIVCNNRKKIGFGEVYGKQFQENRDYVLKIMACDTLSRMGLVEQSRFIDKNLLELSKGWQASGSRFGQLFLLQDWLSRYHRFNQISS